MRRWLKAIALAVAAAALVTLVYSLLTPQESWDHMGMGVQSTYSTGKVALMVASVFIIVASLSIILLWNEYEPLPPSMEPARSALDTSTPDQTVEPTPIAPIVEESNPDSAAAHNYLVLRLLSGDERILFKSVMDAGGEALQKDLIQRTKMSSAKVSRLLDKLSEKGVVTKERFGATNKVTIKFDR